MKIETKLYKEFCKYKNEQNKNRVLSFESLNQLFNDSLNLQKEMLRWAYEKGREDAITINKEEGEQ
jgi:hypothetical protein